MMNIKSLTDMFSISCKARNKGITFIDGRNKPLMVTYNDLYVRAQKFLYSLQLLGIESKQELILQIGNNHDFLIVFWACIMGGIIPVPVSAANDNTRILKILNVWKQLKNPILLADGKCREMIDNFQHETVELPNGMIDKTICFSDITLSENLGSMYNASMDDIAFIQFSSGSTGNPKGVVLTHENLIYNIESIIDGIAVTDNDRTLSWMPLTHDMGLIGFHLAPLAATVNQYIMSTDLFIRRPSIWIDKVVEYGATILSSPNFGYKYFLDTLKDNFINNWDLSHVRAIFNGAEPIDRKLAENFLEFMGKYGLKYETMFPVYGMSEASLAVTFPNIGYKMEYLALDRNSISIGDSVINSKSDKNNIEIVCVGSAVKHCSVRICDNNNVVQSDNIIGHIQIKGKNVTKEYYCDENETLALTTPDGWIKTGDLGFMRNKCLFITGRYKDIIIQNGQNYYPQDIESSAAISPEISLGGIAACNVQNKEAGQEDTVIFVQFKKGEDAFYPLIAKIRENVFVTTGLHIDHVIPVKKIPKTTSGKIQRFILREKFIKNEFDTIIEKLKNIADNNQIKLSVDEASNEKVLLDIAREVCRIDTIVPENNFWEMGLSSLILAQLHDKIEEKFPGLITISNFFEYPSVKSLAAFITAKQSANHSMKAVEIDKNKDFGITTHELDNSIAIIGISAVYPNSEDLDEFWVNIKNGINLTRSFPDERREDIDAYYEFIGENKNNESIKYCKGAYLNEIDKFDYKFFGLSKLEADLMNPIQRLVLETVFHAIEDAGYMGKNIRGSNTGVYFGFISDLDEYKYREMIQTVSPYLLPIAAAGNLSSFIPGRISHFFDLKGPSMLIDTACSSSLVAVAAACDAINLGQCDMAIAGGAKIAIEPIDSDNHKIGIESSDYFTRPFDDLADGSGIGEGMSVILLKSYKKALDDNDNIYAVIKGSSVNQDGGSVKLTAPNPISQANVVTKAWLSSKISPASLSLIEAHGTGTKIGDTVEFEGLKKAFEVFTDKKQFCAIGSIKSNIGHLYDCAGITGLIKLVLALKYKQIPPTILFNSPNKKISFIDSPLYINTKLREWEKGATPRRCGVSSFGISGTNCHLVLEENDTGEELAESQTTKYYALTLSAKNSESIKKLAVSYGKYLQTHENVNIRDICFTSNTGREHYNYRFVVIAQSTSDLTKKIEYVLLNGMENNRDLLIFYSDSKLVFDKNHDTDNAVMSYENFQCELGYLVEASEMYVRGQHIDWENFYVDDSPRKISIPVYPFERLRCWIDIPGLKADLLQSQFYSVIWEKSTLVMNKPEGNQEETILVISSLDQDKDNIKDLLINLKQQYKVIYVKLKDNYLKINDDYYIISNSVDDFRLLLSDITARCVTKIVVNAVNYEMNGLSCIDELENSQNTGVYCLLNLTKALLNIWTDKKIDLVLLINNVYEVSRTEKIIHPDRATLVGLGKVINVEYPEIRCRCIDIDESVSYDDICMELNNNSKIYSIALRGDERYVEKFSEIDIASYPSRNVCIRKHGVYIITGGTGGIGLEIAKYLSSLENIQLILVSKTEVIFENPWDIPQNLSEDSYVKMQRVLRIINDIKSNGSDVVCMGADVSSEKDVDILLKKVRNKFGKIDGIIHAAGIGQAQLLVETSLESFQKVMAPKVNGTWILDYLTRDDNLDFFIMISSAATLFGTPFEGDYTAANSFLDAYANYRNRFCKNSITINWPAWKEIGLAHEHGFTTNTIFKSILTKDAIAGFGTILNKDVSRVFNGEFNLDNELSKRLERFHGFIAEDIIQKASHYSLNRINKKNQLLLQSNLDRTSGVTLIGKYDNTYTLVERKLGTLYKKILRVNEIDINENFFELGGDSFKGASLISMIKKEFNIDITIREMLSCGTLKDMAMCIEGKEKVRYTTIEKAVPKEMYDLSSSQKRMFVLKQIEDEGTVYNNTEVFIIEGYVDKDKVQRSFRMIINRHEGLRTSFTLVNGDPKQIIHENFEFNMVYKDLSNDISNLDDDQLIIDEYTNSFIQPFILEEAPLIRVALIKLKTDRYLLILDTHHIISDGVSMSLIFKEFCYLYAGENLSEPSLQYKDFSEWQNKHILSDSVKQQEKYWLQKFSGILPVLNMYTDFPRPSIQSFEGNNIKIELSKELSDSINRLAIDSESTTYVILLAAFNILLSKYTGQQDIIIGSPAVGRPFTELMDVVGMFVNTLALRNVMDKGCAVNEYIQSVKETVLNAFENQDFQFEDLIDSLNLKRDIGKNPLFDTMFVLENIDYQNAEIESLKFIRQDVSTKTSKMDFILFAYESKQGYYFILEYNTKLFRHETMQRILSHYITILSEIVKNPTQKIREIEMLTKDEVTKTLIDFNNTDDVFNLNKTIIVYFEEQVKRTPQNIAILFGAEKITYEELNNKSNQIARYLRKRGVAQGNIVGIMMSRSIDMIAGLIAILKLGAAYLPIDSELPDKRIDFMLQDSGAKMLITDSNALDGKQFTILQGFEKNNFRIIKTKQRDYIKEFNNLPIPNRSLIDISKYKNRIGMASVNNCISIQTTRGCPYQCLYCHKIWSKHHVHRSADHIFQEIKYYYDKGVKNFAVIDDCFNLNVENSNRLFRQIIKERLKIQIFFPNGLRGDILTTENIDLMVEAGTKGINLSLETASPRLQQMLKKNLDLAKFENIVNYITSRYPNIILEMATMHGFPTETEEEAMMTLDFIKNIKWLHFPYVHILKIFPNTEMEEFALANGVLKSDILKSRDLAFHELPETLPFSKNFTRKYQAKFLDEYFLSQERLKQVLPVQMKILDRSALIQKYNAYLPVQINNIEDLLRFAQIEELQIPSEPTKSTDQLTIFDKKPDVVKNTDKHKKILFLDLSQYFSSHSMLYNVSEQPLGLIYLLTYLKEEFGEKIDGRIFKSGIDFNNYDELRSLIDEYKPDLIGIRSLTFYKEFFHETVSIINQWFPGIPIFAGGPYASSDYDTILLDPNISLVIVGEGEYTLKEILKEMLNNGFKMPCYSVLKNIKGIAYADNNDIDYHRQIVPIDKLSTEIEMEPKGNLHSNIDSKSLAYIIYTSGTTGNPKGIMVEHEQVNNCILWMDKEFNLNINDIVVSRTNLTFDPSVWEIFWTLYKGGIIRLLSSSQGKDANFLIDYLSNRNEATVMYCPASLLTAMTYIAKNRLFENKLKLKWLFIGAEPISRNVINEFYNYFDGIIVNTYGPTECTINNTYYYVEKDVENQVVPIGKPISNNKVYILSSDSELLPTNIPGEICIAGKSVARGYINSPEKTKDRFIKNPYGDGMLYKTGDIGRWTENGNIEILGRTDLQIKIRGYRIEPEEVKSTIMNCLPVEDCVVAVKDSVLQDDDIKICKKCGIGSNYLNVNINEDNICDICENLDTYKQYIAEYFGNISDLKNEICQANKQGEGKYDCLIIFNGGRAAGYALYKLIELGLKVLAVTVDNGFFTKFDIDGIKKITTKLKIDHILLKHDKTNDILRESIKAENTVCRGCFQLSTALAAEYAFKNNIKIVIGATLSRGQIIENKLFMFYKQGITDVSEIEEQLLNIQKLSSSIDSNIYSLINIDSINDRSAYDHVKVIDFYRYCDVSNQEMISYTNSSDDYWRKKKTNAIYSTNCPIKSIGDYFYQYKKGYHYYGSATSWEKRLEHLSLEEVKMDLRIPTEHKAFQNFIKELGWNLDLLKLGEQNLCAYYIAEDTITVNECREALAGKLPEYMIPTYFIKIDVVPLTINGKVDLKKLPIPKKTQRVLIEDNTKFNIIEEKLALIWKDVLEVGIVGLNDDFFDLGGHSLKATVIASKINSEFKVKIPLGEIFRNPTIKELAKCIESLKQDEQISIVPVYSSDKCYPLASSQKSLYFTQDISDKEILFNMTSAVLLSGNIDINKMEKAFINLIKRHEALRSEICIKNEQLVQKIHEDVEFKIEYTEACMSDLDQNFLKTVEINNNLTMENLKNSIAGFADIIKDFVVPFNLNSAPLLRAKLVKITPLNYVLLFDMHHIISDGTSVSIIIKEISYLYSGKQLAEPKVHFKDYCAWKQEHLTTDDYKKHENYWIDKLSSKNTLISCFPSDYPRPDVLSYSGNTLCINTDFDTMQKVVSLTKELDATLNMVLFTAFSILLFKYSKQKEMIIGSPVAGRNRDEIKDVIGNFVNMLPIKIVIDEQTPFSKLLEHTKKNLIEAYENQDCSLEAIIAKTKTKAPKGHRPLFDVVFATQNIDLKHSFINEIDCKIITIENNVSKYDLSIQATKTDETIQLAMDYCTKLFKYETAFNIAKNYLHILAQISENHKLTIADIKSDFEVTKESQIDDVKFDFS